MVWYASFAANNHNCDRVTGSWLKLFMGAFSVLGQRVCSEFKEFIIAFFWLQGRNQEHDLEGGLNIQVSNCIISSLVKQKYLHTSNT